MVIEKEIEINSSIENVWAVLGHDFAHPYKWASSVLHSEGHGKQLATTQCDERACKTVMGNIREKLTHYSDKDFLLEYIVTEGMPSIVKSAKNKWQLTSTKENQTKLKIEMEFIFQGLIGFTLQPLMKMKLNKIAKEMVEDFGYYAEHGRPHPRKITAQKHIKG
jgi:Polyketide cyclase / dehydrase and lipid transport